MRVRRRRSAVEKTGAGEQKGTGAYRRHERSTLATSLQERHELLLTIRDVPCTGAARHQDEIRRPRVGERAIHVNAQPTTARDDRRFCRRANRTEGTPLISRDEAQNVVRAGEVQQLHLIEENDENASSLIDRVRDPVVHASIIDEDELQRRATPLDAIYLVSPEASGREGKA